MVSKNHICFCSIYKKPEGAFTCPQPRHMLRESEVLYTTSTKFDKTFYWNLLLHEWVLIRSGKIIVSSTSRDGQLIRTLPIFAMWHQYFHTDAPVGLHWHSYTTQYALTHKRPHSENSLSKMFYWPSPHGQNLIWMGLLMESIKLPFTAIWYGLC